MTDRIWQIERAHASAKPAAENPAWQNTHHDLGVVLAEYRKVEMALQMLYAETADYIQLNKLGGMDNQCMRLARAALGKELA
jgi:hypothetical protein